MGTQEWWEHGVKHRAGNLPATIGSDGTLEWYQDGIKQESGELDGCSIKG